MALSWEVTASDLKLLKIQIWSESGVKVFLSNTKLQTVS